MTGPDGNATVYVPAAGGGFTSPPGADAVLVHNGDGTWTLTTGSSGEAEHFAAGGALLSDADRNGNTPTYMPSPAVGYPTTITGERAGGDPVTVTYGGCGQTLICQVAQTTGGVTQTYMFGYDSGEHLISVTESAAGSSPVPIPAPRVTRFGYDPTGALTSITTPGGVTTTVGYTTDGTHMTASVDRDSTGVAATTTFDYATQPNSTVVHDPDSGTPYDHPPTVYTIDGFDRVDATTDGYGHARSATWTNNSDVATATDAMSPGGVTTYAYNTNNSPTTATAPTGAKTMNRPGFRGGWVSANIPRVGTQRV